MSSILVQPGAVTVPGLCVACGAPATLPATDAGRQTTSLEASGSLSLGSMVFSNSVTLPLCAGCAGARQGAAERAGDGRYEGRWATIVAGLGSAAAGVGWFAAVQAIPESGLTYALFGLFVVLLIAAIVLSKQLRARHARLHPASEDDLARLELIGRAVKVEPLVSGTEITAVRLTFADEGFFQAFAALNPAVSWSDWQSG